MVIGFYFGSNTLSALLKSRKERLTTDDLSQINLERWTKGDIKEKDYKKIQALIDK